MKKIRKKLSFKKTEIIELNNSKMLKILGGNTGSNNNGDDDDNPTGQTTQTTFQTTKLCGAIDGN